MSGWMKVAMGYEGVTEIKGPLHNSKIIAWLNRLGAWWHNDEDPWCGVFVAEVMSESGYTYPKMYMRAKAWLDWGQRITNPVYGCVVVFDRKGGGHVGFVVGRDNYGRLLVLGGNQGDAVSIKAFPLHRILGYRLPPGFDYRTARVLPTTAAAAALSENEA